MRTRLKRVLQRFDTEYILTQSAGEMDIGPERLSSILPNWVTATELRERKSVSKEIYSLGPLRVTREFQYSATQHSGYEITETLYFSGSLCVLTICSLLFLVWSSILLRPIQIIPVIPIGLLPIFFVAYILDIGISNEWIDMPNGRLGAGSVQIIFSVCLLASCYLITSYIYLQSYQLALVTLSCCSALILFHPQGETLLSRVGGKNKAFAQEVAFGLFVVFVQLLSIVLLVAGVGFVLSLPRTQSKVELILLQQPTLILFLYSVLITLIACQIYLVKSLILFEEELNDRMRKSIATYTPSSWTKSLFYVCLTVPSSITAVLFIYLLLNMNTYLLNNTLSPEGLVVCGSVVASTLLMPLYSLLAVPYRVITSVRDRVVVEVLASPYTSAKYSPMTNVYVIDTEGVIATVMRVWGRGVIVISTGVIEAVREQAKSEEVPADEAIAALLAHEEAHILHGDILQVTRLNLLSVLTFTPRIMLYWLHDFSSAESDADDHAVKQVSAEAITTALRAIKKSQRNSWIETTNLGTARFSSIRSIEQALSTKLGVLYSDFTLSETHARLETRIDRINNEHSDQC